MNERERLIELIYNADNDCTLSWSEIIADYLLERGVIVPPCKVGDKLYVLLCGVEEWRVQDISLSYVSNGEICSMPLNILNNAIGRCAFLTREEAQQALKERDNE